MNPFLYSGLVAVPDSRSFGGSEVPKLLAFEGWEYAKLLDFRGSESRLRLLPRCVSDALWASRFPGALGGPAAKCASLSLVDWSPPTFRVKFRLPVSKFRAAAAIGGFGPPRLGRAALGTQPFRDPGAELLGFRAAQPPCAPFRAMAFGARRLRASVSGFREFRGSCLSKRRAFLAFLTFWPFELRGFFFLTFGASQDGRLPSRNFGRARLVTPPPRPGGGVARIPGGSAPKCAFEVRSFGSSKFLDFATFRK